MLSPTHNFKIFLSKINGKTPCEVLSAADEEMHDVFASPKKRSVSFDYLLDLRILTSYIHLPPRPQDPRGLVPKHFKQILRDLGLIPE
jgi:hypothetical protein